MSECVYITGGDGDNGIFNLPVTEVPRFIPARGPKSAGVQIRGRSDVALKKRVIDPHFRPVAGHGTTLQRRFRATLGEPNILEVAVRK